GFHPGGAAGRRDARGIRRRAAWRRGKTRPTSGEPIECARGRRARLEPVERAPNMIRSFVFSEGKLASQDLAIEALRLVRADKGLILWIDLENPTDEEIKTILEGVFQFHPLAIE